MQQDEIPYALENLLRSYAEANGDEKANRLREYLSRSGSIEKAKDGASRDVVCGPRKHILAFEAQDAEGGSG
jgi:hypothetical protein